MKLSKRKFAAVLRRETVGRLSLHIAVCISNLSYPRHENV